MVGPIPETWAIDESASATLAITPGLWRLRLPSAWPALSHVNAYVLERADRDGITLVDCGGGGDPTAIGTLAAAIAETGWSLSDVRELVVTHFHTDHVGCGSILVAETGCRVVGCPATDHAFESWHHPARVHAQRLARAQADGVPPDLLPAFASLDEELGGFDGVVVPDVALRTGTLIESALGPWEAIETPGHAPSHVCLLNATHRLLFAGDLLAPAFTAWFDPGYSCDPVSELLRSLDRVSMLDGVTALPGHGRPIADAGATARTFHAAVAQGVATVQSAVAHQPSVTAYALSRRLEPEAESPIDQVTAWIVTRAQLEHLVRTRHAKAHRRADGVLVYSSVVPTG